MRPIVSYFFSPKKGRTDTETDFMAVGGMFSIAYTGIVMSRM